MVQLRYPHSAALAVLSRELLRPTPWLWDPEAFKVQQWCSRPSSQLRQLPELQLTADGVLPDAVAAFCSRYSDGDAWGSWQRPMPRRLWEDNNSPGLGLGLAKQQAKRLGGRIKGRSSRSNDPRSVSLDVVVNPTLGSVHQQHLLLAHPRVRQLRAADVAKLASSCCLAGWAAPQLFSGGYCRAFSVLAVLVQCLQCLYHSRKSTITTSNEHNMLQCRSSYAIQPEVQVLGCRTPLTESLLCCMLSAPRLQCWLLGQRS